VNTCISAVEHLRPLRGGAQAHLLKASIFGAAHAMVVVIEASDSLIERTDDLRIQLAGEKIPCRCG
jgi:hypothetical protein